MNNQLFYFAFGSNMNHYRLHQRIGDYENLGKAVLPDHQLVFHKCGGDQSGKCTVVARSTHKVWGLLVSINLQQKTALDYFEGVGHGYSAVYFDVLHQGSRINTLLYQAELDAMDEGLMPFNWYKEFVLTGAKQHNLPNDYIEMIELTRSINDPDQDRVQAQQQILRGIY